MSDRDPREHIAHTPKYTASADHLADLADDARAAATRPGSADWVEWETFTLDPSWKGCGVCREDALGARVGVRPKVALLTFDWQMPEGVIVRVCSNCGHITTMGPILPVIAAEWPVRNV